MEPLKIEPKNRHVQILCDACLLESKDPLLNICVDCYKSLCSENFREFVEDFHYVLKAVNKEIKKLREKNAKLLEQLREDDKRRLC